MDPAAIVVARPKPSAASCSGGGGVQALKLQQRPPRGNAVRAYHGLTALRGVAFAETVQLSVGGAASAGCQLVLSSKDKKTAVRLRPGGLSEEEAEEEEFRPPCSSGSGGGGGAVGPPGQQQSAAAAEVLGEPQTFYRLPDGSWWLEYCRLYSAVEATAAAAAHGVALTLPPGFDRSSEELLKGVQREHAPLRDAAGSVHIRRVKAGGAPLRRATQPV